MICAQYLHKMSHFKQSKENTCGSKKKKKKKKTNKKAAVKYILFNLRPDVEWEPEGRGGVEVGGGVGGVDPHRNKERTNRKHLIPLSLLYKIFS